MDLEMIEVKTIKTKNKYRKIVKYKNKNNELYNTHKHILNVLENNSYPSIFAKAYVKNRSIISNARTHMYNDYFVFIDVKQFFSNICIPILKKATYNEINKVTEVSFLEISEIIDLCTISKRGLPLGLITSPILSNIYMKKTDGIIYGKLKKLEVENIIYTRYADDIIVSFRLKDDYTKLLFIKNEINKIIKKELNKIGLQPNPKKNKFVDINKSNYVKITGINIIKDPNNHRKICVSRSYKKKLFYKIINLCNNYTYYDKEEIILELKKIKGMESFIYSVERSSIDSILSNNMKLELKDYNCNTVHELIMYLENSILSKIL